MDKIIYKDKAGNKIVEKYIKTRDVKQLIGKNAKGGILNPNAFNKLAKNAGLKLGTVKKKGISTVRMYN